MQFFIIFVFGAVILGAGAMLSPAWQTRQPRIGLASALATALILGGAVFWAELFGWDTLVIDYLLFALVSVVVLGGTLSQAQLRAEAQGLELSDEEQGWPGPKDLAFFTFAGLLADIPLLVIALPAGTLAPSDATLATTAKLGGTFNTLAPFYPDVEVLYAPGFHALTAYLSAQLNQPMPLIQFAVSAVISFLLIWLAYDFGAEMVDKRLGRAMVVAMLGGLGLAGMYLNGYFVLLTGTLFMLAFWLYALRLRREGGWADMVGAGLMLGATLYVSPTVTFFLLLGYVPWLFVMGLPTYAKERPAPRTLAQLMLGIPFVALVGTAPWWVNNATQFMQMLTLPAYEPRLGYLIELILYHGIWIVPASVWGVHITFKGRESWHIEMRPIALMALVWWLFIVDSALIGIMPRLLGLNALDARLIAWFAPIIPYMMMAGVTVLWAWERIPVHLRQQVNVYAYSLMSGATIIAGIIILMGGQWLVGGATRNDIEALLWVRNQTPPDSIILNPPDEVWTLAIAERRAVYLPELPRIATSDAEVTPEERAREEGARALLDFWQAPFNQVNLLREHGITHVYLPDGGDAHALNALVDDGHLTLAFALGDALVYQVVER